MVDDPGGTIDIRRARCENEHLGCTCRGNTALHEERSRRIAEARARSGESVECSECGSPTTPLAVLMWGNCRACRTAQSRQINPLRW